MKADSKREHDFRMFKHLKPFFEKIYYGNNRIDTIERDQNIFEENIKKLKKYGPRTKINIDNKNENLENPQNLHEGREMIIRAFKNKFFPLYSGNYYDEYKVSESEESSKSEKSSGSEESEKLSKSKDSEES